MMKKILSTLLLLAIAFSAFAQFGGGQSYPSPVVNPDNTVTFNLSAPNAKNVKISAQFAPKADMTRLDNGVWTITLGPVEPDIYPYSFIIDGTKIADPNNVEIFPNEGYKASLADFKAPEPDHQDLQKVPHGKVSYTWYTSKAVGFDRPVCIYTPAGYDPADSKKYPVLYLIHLHLNRKSRMKNDIHHYLSHKHD